MKRLISSAEAVKGTVQHEKPCSDCPMARTALPGWLGGSTVEEYRQLAHSDHPVPCHVIDNMHCAGMAIYRRNVCKRAAYVLPKDEVLVFSTPMEFEDHHRRKP